MKKKGFTLIELLAVIVILAIIAIISVPIITDLINKSRYGAFGVSKKNIERAAELYHAKNADDLVWEGNISYVTIGTLKTKKFLSNNVVNALDSTSINDNTKVLLYRKGRKVDYSLQLYDREFFDWYQGQMVQASKREDISLPTTVGETVTIDLETLMSKGLVDELRLPLESESRCVGYVEIEKTTDDYEYNAYVDCLQGASTFASHYVSYGGKYMDEFNDVKETSDGGYIAVGRSNSEVITKYGTGNNGKYDAIIVKFKSDGTVEWSENFGGSSDDHFSAVIEIPDGYVAVGQTTSNDGDIVDYKGGNNDGIIVKYNKQGLVTYKRSYGSTNTFGSERFTNIIFNNNHYILVGTVAGEGRDGDLAGATGLVRADELVIMKMDLDFNTIWRSLFVGTNGETPKNAIRTSDNNYLIVGYSNSPNYDMTGIGYEGVPNSEAIILKYDDNGNLLNKSSFRGNVFTEVFADVIEVTDGYIAVGNGSSSDLDMTGLSKANNGYADAVIVKFDKNLENIIWKKSFGGTNSDVYYSIEKVNDNEVVAVGYSKSNDMDMQGLVTETNGYSNALLVRYNVATGNVIKSKTFGGSNSELFQAIIKTSENQYVIAGLTFSNDINLKNFNKGHSDAILVNYDKNFELEKVFQEPVVIIDKLKTIVPSYGTNISLKYDHLYTSNDPTKDLTGWCSTTIPYLEGNTSNYYYGECLRSFNLDDRNLLVELEVSNGLKMYAGEYEYKITKTASHNYNWHQIITANGGSTGNIGYSNLKLKFADGYIGSITDAIDKGYIEPLVVVNSLVGTVRPQGLLPTVIDIINTNGDTGITSYPSMFIYIKPKKSKFVSIILTSSANSRNNDGLSIHELRNFDMSITPTE